MNRYIRKQQKDEINTIYNRIRNKVVIRKFLSSGFFNGKSSSGRRMAERKPGEPAPSLGVYFQDHFPQEKSDNKARVCYTVKL